MPGSRRLIVMRHGKAESFSASDHERMLTDRGVRSAADAGRHLADTGVLPDHAVVSSAARAVGTWEAVAEALQSDPKLSVEDEVATNDTQLTVDDAVYTGSADVVLEALRGVPPNAGVVLFVGHNPSAAYVANQLDDGDGDPAATTEMLQGFPAGSLAVFEVAVPWSEVDTETGRLVDFYVGQG